MNVRRRKDIFWGVLPLAFAGVLMLRALDAIPAGLYDGLSRAWPVFLIVIGMTLLLRGRIPFASLAALGLSGLLVGGVALTAYSGRVDELRTDNVVTIAEAIPEGVVRLVVNVEMLDTDIRLLPGEDRADGVTGTFTGSTESEIEIRQADGVTDYELFIEESRPNQFPMLEAIGRGELALEIPPEINIVVNIIVDDGDATIGLSGTKLELLTLRVNNGDAVVTLPDYQPESLDPAVRPGEITVANGDLTMFVPDTIDVRVIFDRRGSGIQPERAPEYIQAVEGPDGVLRRDVENADTRLYYNVVIPSGLLRLDVLRE